MHCLEGHHYSTILLLQKPHQRSKIKDNISCLERRLKFWKEWDFLELVNEGKALQQHLKQSDSPEDEHSLARSFANFMFEGKTKSALQLICDRGKGGVLHPNETIRSSNGDLFSVMEVLKSKHPPCQPASATALQQQGQETFDIHPIVFGCCHNQICCH